MAALPSVWGKHSEVDIQPVLVRDRLVTTITGEPESWHERLVGLGFRRKGGSWARLGGMVQAEFTYLSPEIDLVGLRGEEVLDLDVSENDAGPLIPLDIQDALLSLWQRQMDSLVLAMELEHDRKLTRGQLWSIVEAAIDGERTPESETLYALAIIKLSASGVVSADAERFMQTLDLPRPPLVSTEKHVLIGSGETVSWTGGDGAIRTGRAAKQVLESDSGLWAYDQSPVWVGSYPVVAPVWVSRDMLVVAPIDGNLRLETPQEVAAEASVVVEQTEQPGTDLLSAEPQEIAASELDGKSDPAALRIECSEEMFSAVADFMRQYSTGVFPFPDWQATALLFKSNPELALTTEYMDEFDSVLNSIDSSLKALNEQFYAADPITFALILRLAGNESKPEFLVAPHIRDGYSVNLCDPMPVKWDGAFHLGAAAKESEEARAAIESGLTGSWREIGKQLGLNGPAFPESKITSLRGRWGSISKLFAGAATPDSMIRLMSVLARQRSGGFGNDHGLAKPLPGNIVGTSYSDKASFKYSVNKIEGRFYEPQALVAWFNEASLNPGVEFSVPVISRTSYEVGLTTSAELDSLPVDGFGGVSVYAGKAVELAPPGRVFHESIEEAMGAYAELMHSLKSLSGSEYAVDLETNRSFASRYHLLLRALEVTEKISAMPPLQLSARIKSEIFRKVPKAQTFGDAYWGAIINSIIEELRSPGVQGTMHCFTKRHSFRRPIQITQEVVTQGREAVLGKAVAEWKARGKRGTYIYIDAIAIADPELATLLNGEGPVAVKKQSSDDSVYSDTGVVSGWAAKDIRGLGRGELLANAQSMTSQQIDKYITREMLWPRMSFDEMREKNVDIKVAFAYDLLWKTIPGKPLSLHSAHVNDFISVVTSFKQLETLLKLPFESENKNDFVHMANVLTGQIIRQELSESARATYLADGGKVRGHRHVQLNGCYVDYIKFPADLSWGSLIKSKKPATKTAGSRVQNGEIVRVGDDHRGGKSVNAEDFIRTFGFSGVEYGNWTNQKEREKHLNFAFDSMMDYVKKMGWEPMSLSLGGKLGLCIGSRGHGGSRAAAAHFEPVNMAINLTRMRGDGSLSHEYFHAVASHYGRLFNGDSNDINDTFGYPLTKAGVVPVTPSEGGLRKEVMEGFYNLMVSIMRKPPEGKDPKDIRNYTETSDMLGVAKVMDKGKVGYWAQPAEMFARAMEIWFKDRMSESGERNDYLVRADKDVGSAGIYPNEEHMERINLFVSPWLESLKTEVSQVTHPYLGDIQMPILCTEQRSSQPLSPRDLCDLAVNEMDRLFATYAPKLMIVDEPSYKAGLYDLSRNLLMLNAQYADKGTFYHEAWHVANDRLLTAKEKTYMGEVFAPDGVLAARVAGVMTEQGIDGAVISHMLSNADEVQAYAFQLWVDGAFTFDDANPGNGSFGRVHGFVDGVINAAGLVGFGKAEHLFTQMMSGELLRRRIDADLVGGVDFSSDADDWDHEGNLVWSPEPVPEQVNRRRSMQLGM